MKPRRSESFDLPIDKRSKPRPRVKKPTAPIREKNSRQLIEELNENRDLKRDFWS